jgi:hypothetical protein
MGRFRRALLNRGHLISLAQPVAGFLVGLLVGFAGVGGGSLMAPVMILLLGVAPTTAVGTDLWFASITKTVGGTIHRVHGATDLKIVGLLCLGSIPGAALTLALLAGSPYLRNSNAWISPLLGAVLIFTAAATFFRSKLHSVGETLRLNAPIPFKAFQKPLTVLVGVILGILVTLTSIGAGALCATALIFLYPLRLSFRKVVGTDILHAIPLTLTAGIGHLWLGHVQWPLLLSLLVGSIPGIVIGSFLVHRVKESIVQRTLAAVLLVVGMRLLAS